MYVVLFGRFEVGEWRLEGIELFFVYYFVWKIVFCQERIKVLYKYIIDVIVFNIYFEILGFDLLGFIKYYLLEEFLFGVVFFFIVFLILLWVCRQFLLVFWVFSKEW